MSDKEEKEKKEKSLKQKKLDYMIEMEKHKEILPKEKALLLTDCKN